MPLRKHFPAVWVCTSLAIAGIVFTGLWLRLTPWQADFSKWQPAGIVEPSVSSIGRSICGECAVGK